MRRRTNLHESGSNSIAREKRKFDGSDITGAWGFKRDKRKRKKKETKQRKKKTHTWASNILTNSSVSSLCIKFLKRQEDCPPPSQLDTFPKSKPRRRAFLLVKTHWLLQWIALHEIHHSKISHPHVPSSCSCILLFIVGIPFLILYFTTTAAAQSDPAPRHLSIVSIAAHPIPYHHPPTPSPRTSFFPHGHPPPCSIQTPNLRKHSPKIPPPHWTAKLGHPQPHKHSLIPKQTQPCGSQSDSGLTPRRISSRTLPNTQRERQRDPTCNRIRTTTDTKRRS